MPAPCPTPAAAPVLICATARLAQYLSGRHAGFEAAAGARAEAGLQAFTFDAWLAWVARELVLRGWLDGKACAAPPLSGYQERVLWERIIERSLGEQAEALFDIPNLARCAQEAQHLALVWGLDLEAAQPLSEESARFLDWQAQFGQACAARGRLDAARWQIEVVAALEHLGPGLPLPGRVRFAGFARFNPLEERLRRCLAGLQRLGDDWPGPVQAEPARIVCRSYPDAAAEALAAALWARERLQQTPAGRWAIVVPDLAASRTLLQDTLEDVLLPQAVLASHAEMPRPFNFSLGQPLASFAVVDAALQMLHLLCHAQQVEQAVLGALLRCPYWSAAQEGASRALLEAALRTRLAPVATLERCVQALQGLQTGEGAAHLAAPQLLRHLQALLAAQPGLQQTRLPSQWALQLEQLLHDAGWLFERKLSSFEYQARQAFLDCMHELAQLDAVIGALPLKQACRHVQRMCQQRSFQPRTVGQPRLQVLGVLEASGLDFDGVWVLGMQDSTWPPPARPNPLLPLAAQRRAQVPNASAAVQLAFAQGVQRALLGCAPERVFSWARMQGATQLGPSPLLPPTLELTHEPAPEHPHWAWAAARSGGAWLEPPLNDSKAPPLAAGERVRGGTWLLRAQAICPAWAYYQYRLGAVRLEEPVEGVDARQRGTLVHAALAHFWGQVQNSQRLHGLGDAACAALVQAAVAQALEAHAARHAPWPPRQRALEQARLTRLLHGWLQVERARTHAFTVLEHEREVLIDVQGLRCRTFIDRIDQLDDGSLLVLDYKTGASVDTDNWASARLTEPQLPLYAALQPPPEGPVVGVVLARVLMREPGWAGLSQQDQLLPKVMGLQSRSARKRFAPETFPDWASVLAHWKACLEAVALEVCQGDAAVRVRDPGLLRYCEVLPLLRLDERQTQWLARQGEGGEVPA